MRLAELYEPYVFFKGMWGYSHWIPLIYLVVWMNWILHRLAHNKFFGEMSHMLLQCRKLLRLGARYRLQAPNDWDTTSHTQVLGYSIEESIHTISIASTERSYFHPQIWIKIRVGRRIVLVSLSPPAVICLLEIKTKIIKFNTRK